MKIFHILLGYLAVTAPFRQVAFASPAGVPVVEHDGDSNVLQQHSGASMRRSPEEIGETRRFEIPVVDLVPIAIIVLAIVATVATGLIWASGDDPKRRGYTQGTTTQLDEKYPKFNWVVCHSPYHHAFDGIEGTDWGHTHHELGISFGRTIGYDLLWARSGTFFLDGDGGFENWAYNGHIIGNEKGGSVVHFGTR